ncbi:interleukin-17D-like [Lethenteron reissneri]|uniref:interleukin-17D-like n=1 Tax=Lethenteron reissneri TaxID=7753 RepID=UPI002AB64D8F|nr:interleukin-17D-like [Lethenteron reissneri]
MAETRTPLRTSGPPRLPRLLLAAVLIIIIATTASTVPAEARSRPPGHARASPRASACRDRSESFLRRELHGCRGSRRRALLNEHLVERLSEAEAARSDAPLTAGGRFAGRAHGVAGRNGSGSRCPSWQGLVASTELEARALAPWTIRVDHDPNRYPSRIAMAECLCSGCVEPGKGAFERSLVSVPVVYRMRALYRRACDPASRLYDYERRWVDVPLACTCVVAKTAPS